MKQINEVLNQSEYLEIKKPAIYNSWRSAARWASWYVLTDGKREKTGRKTDTPCSQFQLLIQSCVLISSLLVSSLLVFCILFSLVSHLSVQFLKHASDTCTKIKGLFQGSENFFYGKKQAQWSAGGDHMGSPHVNQNCFSTYIVSQLMQQHLFLRAYAVVFQLHGDCTKRSDTPQTE